MPFDFQKLGLDRLSQNIKRSVDGGTRGNIVTGDITNGSVVQVTHPGGNTSVTEQVRSRATGAILINWDSANPSNAGEPNWSISGTTLTVSSNTGSAQATFTFWVF